MCCMSEASDRRGVSSGLNLTGKFNIFCKMLPVIFCLFAAQAAFVAGQGEPKRLQVTEQE